MLTVMSTNAPLRWEPFIRQNFTVVGTSGIEFVAKCLWHEDGKKASLYINGKRGVYLCHACGAKGFLGKNGGEALPTASTADIRAKLKALREPQSDPGGRVHDESWLSRFAFPHEYWTDVRGFSDDVIKRFQLGYDPEMDRVTIPLRNVHGQLMGVIQRVLTDEKPKYRYPKGFPIGQHLFAQWLVNGHHEKVALVEGSLDAIACWDARVPALGLLGARLSEHQRQVLIKIGVKTVVIMTDNDRAGREAIFQVHESLTGSGITVRVMQYRKYWPAKDPGELQPQQLRKAYHSAEMWHRWEPNW